jgi:outer membrane protein insertion porin family
LLVTEEGRGSELTSSLGYSYTYDTRLGGLNPTTSMAFRFGQDFAGFGGDIDSVTTTAKVTVQTKMFREEVTLRAELEGGGVYTRNGNSRLLDRFSGNGAIRGFAPNGIGPRDLTVTNQDAVGGNYFAALRLEAEFPLGLPEEYGLSGGLFADIGSVWGLDDNLGGLIDDDRHIRSSVGFSIFWTTALGPLRFNFSKALDKESYDDVQNFDLTVSTRF